MIESIVLSTQALSRPEFPLMLYKQITEAQPDVDMVSRKNRMLLIHRGDEEAKIKELNRELYEIASRKIEEKQISYGASGILGISAGGIIGLNVLLIENFNNITENFDIWGKLLTGYLGIVPAEAGIAFASTLPARILGGVFSKVGGEIERNRIKRTLNADLAKAINA